MQQTFLRMACAILSLAAICAGERGASAYPGTHTLTVNTVIADQIGGLGRERKVEHLRVADFDDVKDWVKSNRGKIKRFLKEAPRYAPKYKRSKRKKVYGYRSKPYVRKSRPLYVSPPRRTTTYYQTRRYYIDPPYYGAAPAFAPYCLDWHYECETLWGYASPTYFQCMAHYGCEILP